MVDNCQCNGYSRTALYDAVKVFEQNGQEQQRSNPMFVDRLPLYRRKAEEENERRRRDQQLIQKGWRYEPAPGKLAKDLDLVPGSFWTVTESFSMSGLQVGDIIEVRDMSGSTVEEDAVTFRQYRAGKGGNVYNSGPLSAWKVRLQLADNEVVQNLLNQRPQVIGRIEREARQQVVRWAEVRRRLSGDMNRLLDRLIQMDDDELDRWLNTFNLSILLEDILPGLQVEELDRAVKLLQEQRTAMGIKPVGKKPRPPLNVSRTKVEPEEPQEVVFLEPPYVVDFDEKK